MVDPAMYLPMSVFDRSRILRWRMGWLPARPVPCHCGAPHASRAHLLACLAVPSRLQFANDSPSVSYLLPNPLDFWLNKLPRKRPSTNTALDSLHSFWSLRWPVILTVLLDMNRICHSDAEFTDQALDTSGTDFINWFCPALSSANLSPLSSIPLHTGDSLAPTHSYP
ncbi:hypothetical protein [Parasitella parasitica]|uniref:Uncharacterized protein n=1 Tax=Parasitella parasitica TaxID=35722 RepID=A0A0B7N8I1_9FUNG|nr:hypothetical protein [Parasitella parasitica]